MTLFDVSGLSPMQTGRLEKALARQFRFSDGVATLRDKLERENARYGLTKSESDSMIEWNRIRFNRMNGAEQREYESRLKSKRKFWACRADGVAWQVPKIVYDAMAVPVSE